jgi:hypothetical protein
VPTAPIEETCARTLAVHRRKFLGAADYIGEPDNRASIALYGKGRFKIAFRRASSTGGNSAARARKTIVEATAGHTAGSRVPFVDCAGIDLSRKLAASANRPDLSTRSAYE